MPLSQHPVQTKLTTYMKYHARTHKSFTLNPAHGSPYYRKPLLHSNFAGLNFSFFFFSYV